MRIYYAHCIAIYDTPQERRDVELLGRLGFVVVNPNDPEVQAAVDAAKLEGDDYMRRVFFSLVAGCDALAFRALPDGAIPAGVAAELGYADEAGRPVFELPSARARRSLTVQQTREYLIESGRR